MVQIKSRGKVAKLALTCIRISVLLISWELHHNLVVCSAWEIFGRGFFSVSSEVRCMRVMTSMDPRIDQTSPPSLNRLRVGRPTFAPGSGRQELASAVALADLLHHHHHPHLGVEIGECSLPAAPLIRTH